MRLWHQTRHHHQEGQLGRVADDTVEEQEMIMCDEICSVWTDVHTLKYVAVLEVLALPSIIPQIQAK